MYMKNKYVSSCSNSFPWELIAGLFHKALQYAEIV